MSQSTTIYIQSYFLTFKQWCSYIWGGGGDAKMWDRDDEDWTTQDKGQMVILKKKQLSIREMAMEMVVDKEVDEDEDKKLAIITGYQGWWVLGGPPRSEDGWSFWKKAIVRQSQRCFKPLTDGWQNQNYRHFSDEIISRIICFVVALNHRIIYK